MSMPRSAGRFGTIRLQFNCLVNRSVPSGVARLLLYLSLQVFLSAQTFSISKIIDANTPRPDGQGNFQNPHTPSTDGQYVVWSEEAGDYSVWAADLSTLHLTRLADTTTAVPGGSGNFTSFTQVGGGPYAGFKIIVRNGTAVFTGMDSAGNGLYSVAATGGAVKRIVNYNTALPNGGRIGAPGHGVYAFGVNDNGSVVFTSEVSGNAADGTALADSVYTAGLDGSSLTVIADEDHLFTNPLQPAGAINSCVMNFGTVAIGNNSVVFAGAGSSFWGIYSLPVSGPAQGVTPVGSACGSGPKGPLVIGSGTTLPGDPASKPISAWDFIQTDGPNVYFHGMDGNIPCCSSLGGGWSGIFSVPLGGGAATKIVEVGDTLPVIGKVTVTSTMFSVDNGGVVFIAANESIVPTQRGIFLYQNGQISKVFASGDSLNGGVLTQNGALEIWPQCYKNGKIAFGWLGGIYVATPAAASGAPSILTGGVGPLYGVPSSSIQPGTFASIYGANLITGQTPVYWNGDFPTSLGGTTVMINNKLAYLAYVSPTQINLQAPNDTARGPVNLTVTTAGGSASATVMLADRNPAFVVLGDGKHVGGVILRTDGSGAYGNGTYDIIGPAGSSLGYATVPAKAGDIVSLFGAGFGPTNPAVPAGQPFSGAAPVTDFISMTINGQPVTPSFAGLSAPGLYQFNLTIPAGLGTGDQPLTAADNGASTQPGVVIALQ
jgi:uncharacterized protein (TIGR03437 family)